MIKVGIPQALLYYQYYPMWRTFFQSLGAEVVVSPVTSEAMTAKGAERVVADTCFPVKVFLGHVISLIDKCDCIFIPVLRSTSPHVYNCSKFLGLADMTRAVIPEAPPILEIEIDVNRGKGHLYRNIYRLGSKFNRNPLTVRNAAVNAWKAHQRYNELMWRERLTPPEAIFKFCGTPYVKSQVIRAKQEQELTSIAVIGHSYLLYDDFINHRLLTRLRQAGCRVLTPELIDPKRFQKVVNAEFPTEPYWTFEDEVVGSGYYYLAEQADGVIGVTAFGCGPDSIMMHSVNERATEQQQTSFMCLNLDEHNSETGIVTRLEAFLDMIKRRKRGSLTTCR